MKLLNVDSLSVSYSHIPTVKDISFSIRPGEIVGLVGESGCGKSTLLRTLMMLMEENCQIDKGSVFFEETDLTKLSEKELRLLRGKDIVMIFQNAALASNPLPQNWASVLRNHYEPFRENVQKGMLCKGGRYPKKIKV